MKEKTNPVEKWNMLGEDEPFTAHTGVAFPVFFVISLYLAGFIRVKTSSIAGR